MNIPSVSSGSDRNLSSRQRVSRELVAEVYGNYDEGCQQFRHRNGKPQSFCRYLCKECGETNFSHVAYVAQSKRQEEENQINSLSSTILVMAPATCVHMAYRGEPSRRTSIMPTHCQKRKAMPGNIPDRWSMARPSSCLLHPDA